MHSFSRFSNSAGPGVLESLRRVAVCDLVSSRKEKCADKLIEPFAALFWA